MARYLFAVFCLSLAGVLPAHGDAPILRGAKPLENRYIVTFREDVQGPQVEALARALTQEHGGHLLGTMTAAMRGLGVELPDGAVEGLRHHPLVQQIEEDQLVTLASGVPEPPRASFAFRQATAPRTPVTTSTTGCPWQSGGYYACFYGTSDTYWNLDRIDNTGLLYDTRAYAFNSTGSGVRAYVVDTGVYATHNEFEGRVVSGANMMVDPDIADDPPIEPPPGYTYEEPPRMLDYAPETNPCYGWRSSADDGIGHGTAVSSVIAGVTTGVAKNATIVPVKVLNCNPNGYEGSLLAIARGLDWIYRDMTCPNAPQTCMPRSGRAVVNMSVIVLFADDNILCEDPNNTTNPPVGYSRCVPSIEHEVNTLIGANIPVVVAAGNQNAAVTWNSPSRMGYGNESAYPSTYRTITVGATSYDPATHADQRWSCGTPTNPTGQCSPTPWDFTQDPGSNYGAPVSIWAPGWKVKVAGASGPSSYRSVGQPSTGTSFAAPLVAGAIARLLEQYPTITAYPSVFDVWTKLQALANQRVNRVDLDPSAVNNDKLLYMSPFE